MNPFFQPLLALVFLFLRARLACGQSAPVIPSWSSSFNFSTNFSLGGSGSSSNFQYQRAVLSSPDGFWNLGVVLEDMTPTGLTCILGVYAPSLQPSSSNLTWNWQGATATGVTSYVCSFQPYGDLQLFINDQQSPYWRTNITAQAVELTDAGELLLLDANNNTVWQSSNSPSPPPAAPPVSPPPPPSSAQSPFPEPSSQSAASFHRANVFTGLSLMAGAATLLL